MHNFTIENIKTKYAKFCDSFSYADKPEDSEPKDIFDYWAEQKKESSNRWLDDYGWI